MIDLNKLLTSLAIKFANKSAKKHFVEETPKFGLPDYTVSSVYKQDQIERIIIRPNSLISKSDHLQIDNEFRKYYFVQRIPDYLNPSTFAEILSLDDVDVEIAYKLFPRSSYDKASEIKDNLLMLGAQLLEAKSENYHTKSLHKLLDIQESALAKLEGGNENSFTERIFIIVKADSKKNLDYSCDYLEKFLKGKNILIKSLDNLQTDAYMETLPVGSKNNIIPGREILSEQVEQRYMLVKPQVQINKDSIIWGYDQSGLPLFFNQWTESPAYNWIMTGMTGQGKSVQGKTVFVNQCTLMIDERGQFNGGYVVIDPNQEYEDVVQLTNGVYVKLGPDSDTRINILDCMNLTRGEKLSQLEYVFPLLFGNETEGQLSAPQWDAIRRSLVKCYESKGIGHDYHISKGYKEQPTLNELYTQMNIDRSMLDSHTQKQSYEAMITRLTKFINVDGEYGQFAFMSESTKGVDFANLNRMAFSIQGVERSIKAGYMYLIIDNIWRQMAKNRENDGEKATKFMFLMDEVHMLFNNKFVRESINQMAAVARKYMVSMGFITQRISTYKEGSSDGEGSSILANTHVKIFLAQDDIEAAQIGKMYNLDKNTVDRLQTLGLGQFYMMVRANKYKFTRFLTNIVFSKGLELFETNAQKILDNRKRFAKEKQKLQAKFKENAIAGMNLHFKTKYAYQRYSELLSRKDLNEKDKKQFDEYDSKYKEFGMKSLSPSEAITYEYILFKEKAEQESSLVVKPEIKEVHVSQVHEKPELYYFVDQLDANSLDELEKMGYVTVTYRLSQKSSMTYVTKIQSHKHMSNITQKDATDYSSAKNAGKLSNDVKHAIDHHMMQVHAHSILSQFVNPDDIKMYESVEADIEFPGPDGNTYAIEAETGSQLYQETKLENKIKANDGKYGSNWVIYVPKAELVHQYVELLEKYSKISSEEAKGRVFYRTTIKEYLDNVFISGGNE